MKLSQAEIDEIATEVLCMAEAMLPEEFAKIYWDAANHGLEEYFRMKAPGSCEMPPMERGSGSRRNQLTSQTTGIQFPLK